jgi:3-hydroxybutyryl-CoA dehydrogenase
MQEENLRLEDLLERTRVPAESGIISKVAIIGAGVMGQGIAQTVADSSIDVLIIEQDKKFLAAAKNSLSEYIDNEIKRWAMTNSEKKSIFSRIDWETNLDNIKDCDLVIEAVTEDFDLKLKIFREVDKMVDDDCILVSITSTLSLTKLAEATSRPDKVIGLHFLSPVPKIPVVEVVKCLHTSNDTVDTIKTFVKDIRKTPVEVYEYPGFVTTRAIVPLLNEAMHILLEGVASAKDIDTAMKLGYNFQYGPLEMADNMGLDEVLTWMETLWKTLGEPRYRACPILRKLVRERKLGKKSGEGFYKYDEHGNIIN